MIVACLCLPDKHLSIEVQRTQIMQYIRQQQQSVNRWIQIDHTSKKRGVAQKALEQCLNQQQDIVLTACLSCLGYSLRDVLELLEWMITQKQGQFVALAQNFVLDIGSRQTPETRQQLALLEMIIALEKDFIAARTKDGLAALQAKGVKLGKPKGIIQRSGYDKDQERIFALYRSGVPLKDMLQDHLHYGSYSSLRTYLRKRYTD